MIHANISNEEIIEQYEAFLNRKKLTILAGFLITVFFMGLFYLITGLVILSGLLTVSSVLLYGMTYHETFVDNPDVIKLKKLYQNTQKYNC